MTVKILGTDYEILIKNENEDAYLKQCDGYCDKTSKKIVLTDKPEDNELEIFDVYARKIMRHEVLHAFLFESGLAENIRYEASIGRQDEQMIDWFAIQFPKILKAYQELGIADTDMVAHGDYEQVKWERDCAIQQLQEDYGVGLGEMKPENFFGVVFCKDCKYSRRDIGLSYCEKLRRYQKDFDFCSYGERRKKDDGKGMAE